MNIDSPDHHQLEEHDPNMETAILEEEIDPNYEPSEDELFEYAKFLGMDLEEDKDFLHIAREGLLAALPEPWKACRTREGQVYYFNFESGESQWEHPLDELYRKKFQETKALFNKKFENREEQKFQKQLQKQQKMLHTQPSLQRNTSTSNIIDSNMSGLSYSHHNSNSHVGSGRKKESDQNGSSHMNISKELPIIEAGEERNESINFSGLHLEEDIKWQGDERQKIYEEVENEYSNALMRYQEQLTLKFNEFIADYETQYQEEAQKLESQFQAALKKFMHDMERENPASNLDAKKKEAEMQIRRETERDIEITLEKLLKDFSAQVKKLEAENDNEIEDEIFQVEEQTALEIDKLKENLEKKISEINEAMEEKEKRKQDNMEEMVKNEEMFSKKKIEMQEEFAKKLKNVEQEELNRMAKEVESFQKELEVKLEREKKVMESTKRQMEEHFSERRAELAEYYTKRYNEERHRLAEENEQSTRESLTQEKRKAEETAEKKAETHFKNEYDRKFNSMEVEKLLSEQQNKKKLEEVKIQAEKKLEQDKATFLKETESKVEDLKKELKTIDEQIAAEQINLQNVQKLSKEAEATQKEIKDKEFKVMKIETEIAQLQKDFDNARSQYDECLPRLNSIKQSIVVKNHIIVKVEEMYRKIEEKEKEIESIKQKQAEKASKLVNDTINTSLILPSNNITKILKEIEDIKGVVALKKEVTKKSRSVGRLGSRRRIMPFNAFAIDQDKTQSMIEDNLESDEEVEVSRTLDVDSRILKSRHFDRSVENRIIEENSPELSSYKRAPTFGNRVPKKTYPSVDWKKFILNEKAKLEKMQEGLYRRKLIIRTEQEELKNEQNNYKTEYNNFKNNPNSSTLKLKLDILKKSLNLKIKSYNDKLTDLRTEEKIHKSKKDLLHKIESSFAKFVKEEVDEGTLHRYHDEYNDIKLSARETFGDLKTVETIDVEKSLTTMTTIDTDANRLLRKISKAGIKENSQRSSSTRREDPYNKENVSLQANISLHHANTIDVRDSLDAQRSTKSHSSFFDERYQVHDRLKISNLKQRSEKYFKQYDEMMRKYSTNH